MRRDLVLIAVFLSLAQAKICPSIDTRNNPSALEVLRNCTIVAGHLHIVLMHHTNDSLDFPNYTFPELVEVSDYLLVFMITLGTNLTNLGTVFPNLKLIRGNRLITDYALIIWDVAELEQIGLTSLQHIGNGGVMVHKCPQLCYVKTINWTAIGASKVDYYPENLECNDHICPQHCAGHCWNYQKCQLASRDICMHYEDEGKCVEKCPDSKVTNNEIMRCQTREECTSIGNAKWWVFNNTCIRSCPLFYYRNETAAEGCLHMGKNYIKWCEIKKNDTVSNATAFNNLYGCTHIDGSLDMRIVEPKVIANLVINLGNIVSITGYLKIARSKNIRSLDFFKNLTEIKGETLDSNRYSMFIFENQNLQTLWNNSKLYIQNGEVAFHQNPQLCYSEINKLMEIVKRNNEKITLVEHANGYQSICNEKDVNITIIENNPTNVTITWLRPPGIDNETIIGYSVQWRRVKSNHTPIATDNVDYISEQHSNYGNNKDVCAPYSWVSTFVTTNQALLHSLRPASKYAYYIKSYMSTGDNNQQQQTPIYYFVTAPELPTEPIAFKTKAENDSSIILTWKPPVFPNGNLTHYKLYVFLVDDFLPTIQQRNYCTHPFVPKIDEQLGFHAFAQNTTECSCETEEFHSVITPNPFCKARKDLEQCMRSVYFGSNYRSKEMEKIVKEMMFKRDMEQRNNTREQMMFLGPNLTTYQIVNLNHFTLYTFYLAACNMNGAQEQCSKSVMDFARTHRNKNADNVTHVRVEVEKKKNAFVQWSEPDKINSVLVGYLIEYKRTDSEHSKSKPECLAREGKNPLVHQHYLVKLSPGKYAARVQAISLAGPGAFSEWKSFEVIAESGSAFAIYGPILLTCFVAIILAGAYFWYKHKHDMDIHLITSVNPDYAGPLYEEDEWEVDRDDVQIIREVGQGSFGMVYEGMIKSRKLICAIKTVNENTTLQSRVEFLNEGSVMKTFKDSYHVIKLLGIVSRGQPPYVLMELMERGDLKSYLRRCRKPSQNLTTNETYRMAAEIADGMAYLTAKKFVHRDLAARNCMVAADRTVKIGDFGMARDIYENDYYRKETGGLLPVRWMAPESLADGVFTSDSDVWSYGMVLWEMATLAEQPYKGLTNEQVFRFVKTKGRLQRPPECSDFLYDIMDACWKWRPNDRPTFSDIVHKLVDHVGQDFRLVAFVFSRHGQELALNAGPRVYNPPAMLVDPDEDAWGHYDPDEEEVSLYLREEDRPTKYLPFPGQSPRDSPPYRISPGSPASSTFSFESTS